MRGHWHHRHRDGPPPFVRRMGCAFGALIFFSMIGSGIFASLFFRDPQRALFLGGPAVLIVATLVAGFGMSMRRMATVFREQDRLRRQLMADVAHELRTPLSVLQGRIEGLLDGVYPRDDARLGELLDETKHLSRLVEDLRTIANAEAGALELRKESVNPADVISDAAAAFDRPIDVDIRDGLQPIELDPIRIREVLLNVLGNAVRHTPSHGAIVIHAETTAGRLIIRVTDSGSGITPEELPRIFDRFHKGRDSHGSGLGLSIAKNLVVAHGGEIHASSEVGRGTTVTITL